MQLGRVIRRGLKDLKILFQTCSQKVIHICLAERFLNYKTVNWKTVSCWSFIYWLILSALFKQKIDDIGKHSTLLNIVQLKHVISDSYFHQLFWMIKLFQKKYLLHAENIYIRKTTSALHRNNINLSKFSFNNLNVFFKN